MAPRIFASVLIWLFIGQSAQAARIIVVKSSDAEPYIVAEAAVATKLAAPGNEVRGMLLKEVSEKGIQPTIGPANLVVAIGTPAAKFLHKQLPPSQKLVYCMVTSPEEVGLLSGRESWGVSTDLPFAQQFQIIGQTLPHARAIGVLYRTDCPEGDKSLVALKAALPAGWRVSAVAVNDYPSVAAAIDALTSKGADIIWTTPNQKVYDAGAVRALLLAGLRAKTPVWGFSPAFVRAGATIGVGVDPKEQGFQAAEVAGRALAGQAGVPDKAQPPREFQIAVNLIVAKEIGVEIPDAVTRRAAYVYRPEK